MSFRLRQFSPILAISICSPFAISGTQTTLPIDVYNTNDATLENSVYQRDLFNCQVTIESPEPSYVDDTLISESMKIVKVHNDDYRVFMKHSDGTFVPFYGYGKYFEWHFDAATYTQSVSNDADRAGLEIDLNKYQGRKYRGTLTTEAEYWVNTDVPELVFDLSCELVVDDIGNAGMTSLMEAAFLGDNQRLHRELEGKSARFVNMSDENGYTALMYAVMNNYSRAANQLIEAGADINQKNVFGNDALNYALSLGNNYVSWLLLRAGASGTATNLNGDTAFSLASQVGLDTLLIRYSRVPTNSLPGVIHTISSDDLRSLIDLGVDLEAKYEGNTALHLSSLIGDFEKTSILLEAGANIEVLNNQNETALSLASRNVGNPVIDLLIAKGAIVVKQDAPSALTNFMIKGDFERVYALLDRVDTMDNPHAVYNGLFMDAVSLNNQRPESDIIAMMNELISRGANVSYIGRDRATALILAANQGKLEVVKYLVDQGSALDVLSSYQFTAIGYARYYEAMYKRQHFGDPVKAKLFEDIAQYLQNAGADETIGRQPINWD